MLRDKLLRLGAKDSCKEFLPLITELLRRIKLDFHLDMPDDLGNFPPKFHNQRLVSAFSDPHNARLLAKHNCLESIIHIGKLAYLAHPFAPKDPGAPPNEGPLPKRRRGGFLDAESESGSDSDLDDVEKEAKSGASAAMGVYQNQLRDYHTYAGVLNEYCDFLRSAAEDLAFQEPEWSGTAKEQAQASLKWCGTRALVFWQDNKDFSALRRVAEASLLSVGSSAAAERALSRVSALIGRHLASRAMNTVSQKILGSANRDLILVRKNLDLPSQ